MEKEEVALSPPCTEAKKAVLAQRKRDLEVKPVHALIEGDSVEQDTDSSLNLLGESLSYETESFLSPTEPIPLDDDNDLENCQPLEEW